jgi:hypothetical protein
MSDRPQRSELGRGQDIEQALVDLGRRIDYPPTPDLASGTRAALAVSPRTVRRDLLGALLPSMRPLPRAMLGALIALLLVAGTVIAIGIGLRGLGITFVDELPAAPEELQLGDRVTLSEAQARVPYRIALPHRELGEPEVFVDTLASVEQVNLAYRRDGDVELLLTQFVARPDTELATKLVAPGTSVEELTVAGGRGLWIEGEPHVLLYRDASGATLEDRVRLVGNVLLWQKGELTLRLEGVVSKAEALRIAEAVQ